MQFVNPFEQDTQYYRQMIDGEAHPGVQDVDFVEVDKDGVQVLEENTQNGFSEAFKRLQEAKERAEIKKEDCKHIAKVFTTVVDRFNQEYNLSINFDSDSFTSNLENIIDPVKKVGMELYLSELYSRVRVVLYQQFLQNLTILATQISDESTLYSQSMTMSDKFDMMDRLFEFLKKMNEIKDQIDVPNAELKLKKLGTGKGDVLGSEDTKDPQVTELLHMIASNIKQGKVTPTQNTEVK